jgi:hypothetical protein
MIIMWTAGGLGNQLFIINKALELNKDNFVLLDTRFYRNDIRYKRKFHFEKKFKIIPILNERVRFLIFKLKKILNKFNLLNFYEESDYKQKNNGFFKILYLTGYWQEDIKPSKENINLINNVFHKKQLMERKYVAVHFRSEEYDIKLPKEYYKKALKSFNKEEFEFHLFGDSQENLEEMGKTVFKNTKFKIVKLPNEILEFEKLKSYRNYISSNSTFCWWAIILNQEKALKVTSPKKWNTGYEEEYNIYRPSNWILI